MYSEVNRSNRYPISGLSSHQKARPNNVSPDYIYCYTTGNQSMNEVFRGHIRHVKGKTATQVAIKLPMYVISTC